MRRPDLTAREVAALAKQPVVALGQCQLIPRYDRRGVLGLPIHVGRPFACNGPRPLPTRHARRGAGAGRSGVEDRRCQRRPDRRAPGSKDGSTIRARQGSIKLGRGFAGSESASEPYRTPYPATCPAHSCPAVKPSCRSIMTPPTRSMSSHRASGRKRWSGCSPIPMRYCLPRYDEFPSLICDGLNSLLTRLNNFASHR